MSTLLRLYLDHATGDRTLTLQQLVEEGHSESYARVLLHRLRESGAAVPDGQGRVQLVLPGHRHGPPADTVEPPWRRSLLRNFKVKATGSSALPNRYPSPRPEEFVLPQSQLGEAVSMLRRNYPKLQVYEGRYVPEQGAVCLYPGRVQGKVASPEEALLHLYRHAPRKDFAFALQAFLMEGKEIKWHRLREQPEWPELAGIFTAINELACTKVFPSFRTARAPDLTYAELATVAQPFTARGSA